jgi:hypothetical protein
MDIHRTGARKELTAQLRTPRSGSRRTLPLTAAQDTTVQGWRERQGDGVRLRPSHGRARHVASAVIALCAVLKGNRRALARHVESAGCARRPRRSSPPQLAPRQGRSGSGLRSPRRRMPDPASSSNTNQRGPDRFGDQQLNSVHLDDVARTNASHTPPPAHIHLATHRRRPDAAGSYRCLKRFIARRAPANSGPSCLDSRLGLTSVGGHLK